MPEWMTPNTIRPEQIPVWREGSRSKDVGASLRGKAQPLGAGIDGV